MNIYKLIMDDNKLPKLEATFSFEINKEYSNLNDYVYDICKNKIKFTNNFDEYTYIFAFGFNDSLKGIYELSHGAHSDAPIYHKELFMFLLLIGAESFIIVHNHPSGNIRPSMADLQTTSLLSEFSKLLKIDFLDALVIGKDSYEPYKKVSIALIGDCDEEHYDVPAFTLTTIIPLLEKETNYSTDGNEYPYEINIYDDIYPVKEDTYRTVKAMIDISLQNEKEEQHERQIRT